MRLHVLVLAPPTIPCIKQSQALPTIDNLFNTIEHAIKSRNILFHPEHLDDNPDQLLWKKNEYPDDRVVLAVEQIQARENIKEKLPSWYACRDIFYPSKLSTEQCSSETTAPYKARLATGNSLSATSRVAWASTRTSFPGK